MDKKAGEVRNKPVKTTADKGLLFANGLARSTPIGAIHQLSKIPEEAAKMTPAQAKVAADQTLNKAFGALFNIMTGHPEKPIMKSLQPTVQKAAEGDYEAMGEVTGIMAQVLGPKFFRPKVETSLTEPFPSLSKSYTIFEGESKSLILNAEFNGKITVENDVLHVQIDYIAKIDKNNGLYSTYNNLIDKVESLAKQHGVKEIKITGEPINPSKADVPFVKAGYTVTSSGPAWESPVVTRTKKLIE